MSAATDLRLEAVRLYLQTVVPLKMLAMQARGGPSADDRAAAAAYETVLERRGEELIFGGGNDQAALFGGLAQAIAVLSFHPGGVTPFGLHFAAGEQPVYGRATE